MNRTEGGRAATLTQPWQHPNPSVTGVNDVPAHGHALLQPTRVHPGGLGVEGQASRAGSRAPATRPLCPGAGSCSPLGLVETLPFRLPIFASFRAKCAVFALFGLQFSFV